MTVEAHKDLPGVWVAELIDDDGGIEQALFVGPRAQERAFEYEASHTERRAEIRRAVGEMRELCAKVAEIMPAAADGAERERRKATAARSALTAERDKMREGLQVAKKGLSGIADLRLGVSGMSFQQANDYFNECARDCLAKVREAMGQ